MSRIGDLRHRVAVENPTRTPDGSGGFTETFAAASPSPVWARIEPATPAKTERLISNVVEGPITHIVTMRDHSGVTMKTRLTFETSRRFHVRGIQHVEEMGQWLRLACEEY